MEKRELTCIGCPLGCALTVSLNAGKVISVEGYTCKRGHDYGEKECTNPMRTVTSSVPVKNGVTPMVSVKTAADIPKGKILECMDPHRHRPGAGPPRGYHPGRHRRDRRGSGCDENGRKKIKRKNGCSGFKGVAIFLYGFNRTICCMFFDLPLLRHSGLMLNILADFRHISP